MPNGAERQAVVDAMIEILRRDAPWVWGFHPLAYTLYHDWYGNSKPNLMARNLLKYKTIDPTLRAQMQARWNRPVIWPVMAVLFVLLLATLPAWRSYVARQQATAK